MSNLITSQTLKLATSYARNARQLWNALALHTGHESINSDGKRDSAERAQAMLGKRFLTDKLPRNAGALRAEVESMKQKAVSLLAQCDGKHDLIPHCERKSVALECSKAIRYCDQFVAEYKEAKANANVAKAA